MSFSSESPDYKEAFSFEYNSGIEDYAAKIDFDYLPTPDHSIKFGVSNTYHTFNPGVNAFNINSDSNMGIDTTFGGKAVYANEIALYAEDDVKIGSRFKMNAGLHYSGFYVKGKYYQSLQPRISMRYKITDNWSVKAGYSNMYQNIHLLTNASVGLPTDLWLPVTDTIKPQIANQIAISTVVNIRDKYDISLEAFYKKMDNLIEYKEGASFLSASNDWEDKIEIGQGWSYGVEFLIKKDYGKTTGWIGYTLSWAERQFENISFGERFPYRYDRRHDISFVLIHKFSNRIDIGATWVYGTGSAVTLPSEKYMAFNQSYWSVSHFDKRNNFRLPAYHRFDFSVNFHKERRWGERTWSFGAYNLYNRQNPFFVYFTTNYINNVEQQQLIQVSLFPIIPSVSYRFQF